MGYLLPDYGAIEARADAATPGPWYVVGPPWNDGAPFVVAGNPDPHAGKFVLDTEDMSDPDLGDEDEAAEKLRRHRDAEFVAAARSDVPVLATAALRYLSLLAQAERDRDAALADRDAAQDQAARLAHVLHAVDTYLGSREVVHDAAAWERRQLAKVVSRARDSQQLVSPYEIVAVHEGENAALREALRRIRDGDEPTEPERDAAEDAMGDDLPDYPRDSVVIAAATLAVLDPLAPEPAEPAPDDGERPVTTLALPPVPTDDDDAAIAGNALATRYSAAEPHWLTRYDPEDGEPHGALCFCDIDTDHDAHGNPMVLDELT